MKTDSFDNGILTGIRPILTRNWAGISLGGGKVIADPTAAPPLLELYTRISQNLDTTRDIFRSSKNWRFTVEKEFDADNESTGKVMEKLIASRAGRLRIRGGRRSGVRLAGFDCA